MHHLLRLIFAALANLISTVNKKINLTIRMSTCWEIIMDICKILLSKVCKMLIMKVMTKRKVILFVLAVTLRKCATNKKCYGLEIYSCGNNGGYMRMHTQSRQIQRSHVGMTRGKIKTIWKAYRALNFAAHL